MTSDFEVTVVVILAFAAVSTVVFVLGQHFAARAHVQNRVAAPGQSAGVKHGPVVSWNFDHLVRSYFDEKKFGVEGQVRARLRRNLIRAAFFNSNALNYYIFARLASVVVVTIGVYMLVETLMADGSWLMKFSIVAVGMLVAVLGPDAYLARRQRTMHDHYR